MKALISTAIAWPSSFSSNSGGPFHRESASVRARFGCWSRKSGEVNGLPRPSVHMELQGQEGANISQVYIYIYILSSNEDKARHDDIWGLFKEAQQNILYLNKQRQKALEELNRTNQEKELLLEKIAILEAKMQSGFVKDRLSFCWELLLRIDSMVLTGIISTNEASDMRRLLVEHKVSGDDFSTDILQETDVKLLHELRNFLSGSKGNGFHIVHICTEMSPLVSVGSLASYVTGLSRALQRKGYLVEVILPKYGSLDLDEVQGLREIEAESYSYFNGQLHANRIWIGVAYGIGVTLIEPKDYASFFNREKVYGYSDDFERFTYFSRASLDYIVKAGKKPDVLHIHNWETAIVGPLFWDIFVKQSLEQPDKLSLCGLDPARLHRPDRLQDNTNKLLINILKGGVVYSNKVIFLSSIHSKSRIIYGPNHGLEPTLDIHKDKLVVAPLGFDSSIWDPSKDRFLPKNYSVDDMKGKAVCKVALQQQLGLSDNGSSVLVGFIFCEVSDVDLESLKSLVRNTSSRGVQFIIMDLSKIPSANMSLGSFQEELKGDGVRFISRQDEASSHLVFAGSDIILCPSFHDPILQLPEKALKYGAAPVALSSNSMGFRHSIDHHAEATRFSQFISSTFENMSLNQALDEIRNNPSKWKQRIMEGMALDLSWDAECCDIHISAYTAIKDL
ncbi:hypothetical protein FEM48_Zijuj08G0137400 [Ziziphus jujuba var. spinosa]|uniref:starch synthase n=1 Tax=Ziziphus jujuba var. spinosa TaxID=714518 RepID=A0A978UZG0_ZIZJJ|nr:hypothetical protein FEM48_Zijuj08G0137400 [Ziziphus jujuba var. spinosa]